MLPVNVEIPETSKLLENVPIPASTLSRCAIPSICKSLHSLDVDPKSYVSSSSGVILESTSALNTTLSVAASPSVIVPPLNVVVPVTVKFHQHLSF